MGRRTKKNPHSVFYPTPKKVLTVLAVLVIGYTILYLGKLLLHHSGLFVVESVKITGNHYIEEKNIQTFANIDLNQSMFEVDLANITDNVLRNPYIRGVSVTRALPSTIQITVQEREPVFYLVDKSVYLVDETGMILKKLPRMPMGKLPIITGLSVEKVKQDSTLMPAVLRFVNKIYEVDASLIPFISEINYTSDHQPEIVLVNGAARVKIGRSHHYTRLYLLSQFLKKQPVVEKLPRIRFIDLRFADRIVVQHKS